MPVPIHAVFMTPNGPQGSRDSVIPGLPEPMSPQ